MPDPATLLAELDAIGAQLNELGVDRGVLVAHLGIVVDILGEAPRQLWAAPITLCLDAMNIQRDARDPSGRSIEFLELHNARDRRVVVLPLSIAPGELPAREDLVTAAQRYLQ